MPEERDAVPRSAASDSRAEQPEPIAVSADQAMETALEYHKSGRLAEAAAIYRSLLKVIPEHPGALHFLGVLTHQQGDSEHAVELIRRAINASRGYVDAYNNLGNVLNTMGRLDAAAEAYAEVVRLAPDNAAAYSNLATVLRKQGALAQALTALRRAADLDPTSVEARFNCGNVLAELGRSEEAAGEYRLALELDPAHADAYFNLGRALSALDRHDEAAEAYRDAASHNADHAEAHSAVGDALMRKGLAADAERAYRRAVALRPDLDDALEGLAKVLYSQERLHEAEAVVRHWVSQAPAHPVARHLLASMTGVDQPARASDAYVRRVFDDFAGSFDEVLERLQYSAPRLVAAAIPEPLSAEAALDVLDAGCGTGLCAKLLKPYARRLVGVDLSSGMLAKAAAGALYDELVEDELTRYLSAHPDAFDLIACADTLCYFGDLGPVLSAAATALRGGGLLVFTVEHLPERDGAVQYRLHPHGRYGHTRGYVERVLREAGLEVLSANTGALRLELEDPVAGLAICARRPGA